MAHRTKKKRRPPFLNVALLALLFFLLFPSDGALAQTPDAQVVQPAPATAVAVERSTAFQLHEQEHVVHVATGGRVVVSKRQGGTVRFTLRDLDRGTSMALPFEATYQPGHRERYYLRVDGRYVLFSGFMDSKLSIFNTQTGQVQHVTHDGENMVGGSISSATGDVLYQVREDRVTNPRVFLLRKGETKPTLIAKAMGGQWSPDGRFFKMKRRRTPEEPKARGEIKHWDWWVYNQKVEPVLDLSRYGRSNAVEWAPTSDKLVFEATFEKPGFYVLYLARQSEDLEVAEARYIQPPEGWGFSGTHWSSDGSRLAFGAWAPGDETGEDSQLRVLTDQTYEQYIALPSLAGVSGFGSSDWNWTSSQALYAPFTERGTVNGEPEVIARKLVRLQPNF